MEHSAAGSGPASCLLAWTEAVAKTSPEAGPSIGRGTTLVAPREAHRITGTTPTKSIPDGVFVPLLLVQPFLADLRDSLRQKEQRRHGRLGLLRCMEAVA